jgi:S-adenosylmethionine hydrolase
MPYFPPETIHVAVVDPGVGSTRRALLIRTAAGYLIGPDNGVLSLAAKTSSPYCVYSIENDKFFRHPVSQTFHGRDIFAPVAAHLSNGIAPGDFGPEIGSMVELDIPAPIADAAGVRGEVVYVDHFGNLVTNIDSIALAAFHGHALSVNIGSNAVAGPVTAYAAVDEGTPVALIGSWSVLEIAVRNGDAAKALGAGPGTPVSVTKREAKA